MNAGDVNAWLTSEGIVILSGALFLLGMVIFACLFMFYTFVRSLR